MPNYTDHNKVLIMIAEAQEAEQDIRELSRSCDRFIDDPDGQWDPDIIKNMGDRPMMTYDETSGIVDDIAGDIESTQFAIKVSPAGGEASEDTAELYSGHIRNVENMSNASSIYSSVGRGLATRGFDGCRVVTKHAQSDSFDQDFFIVRVSNFIDRVWFDPASEEPDRSDANWQVDLQNIPVSSYEEQFPKGSKISVSDGRNEPVYNDQIDSIIVGELLYKKKVSTVLVKMSSGAVYTEKQLKPVAKELKAQGVTALDRRTAKIDVVYSRKFDGGGWLEEENKTIFEFLPIVPAYAVFKIFDNKVSWRGEVQKKMDAQRSLNYARSRMIEEGALAPRDKLMITEEQAEGHEESLETSNTNNETVQYYNHTDGQVQPYKTGGPQINQGLAETAATAQAFLKSGSGQAAQQTGLFQSGVAQREMQNKADNSNIKYSAGIETMICHIARIIVNATPKLFSDKREARILAENGNSEMVTFNDRVFDEETQKVVKLNDLSKGIYDVTCSAGPAFKNRQEETVNAILEVARIDPGIVERNGDILLGNINAPGMDTAEARERKRLVQAGVIPESQLTDDEKAEIKAAQQAAAQQPQEPSPEEKAANSMLQDSATNRAKIQSDIEDTTNRYRLDIEKSKIAAENKDQDQQLEAQKIALENRKLDQQENVNDIKFKQMLFDNEAKIKELALKVTEMETTAGKDLSSQISENAEMLVFDPAVGDFI